ncbi:MAG: SDR family oxidoreductase [Bryobacterales bacterium]|nr:SDR family oxidoreductase [Bryobacterales bacterium]
MTGPRQLAVITGASSGIGATFARKLAERGYDLVLIARRGGRLQELAAEVEARHGIRAQTVVADLTVAEDLQRLCSRMNSGEAPALLVNNAGFGLRGAFAVSSPETQRKMYLLHVVATSALTRAVLPGMMKRQSGAIINVSSVAAFVVGPGNVSYCATKAWMNSFTEGLWAEMKALGSPVIVQALCPGFTYSEFHDVMGVRRDNLGRGMWMPPDFVVSESLKGLDRGARLVIPGWRYRLLVALLKIAPKAIVLRVVARNYNRL